MELQGLIRDGDGWQRKVAGLTLLDRAVLALRRGGAEGVVVLTDDPDGLKARLSRGRLADDLPELLTELPASAAAASAPTLELRRPVAIDAGFVEGAAARLGKPDEAGQLAGGAIALRPAGLEGVDDPTPVPILALGGTAVAVSNAAEGRAARRGLLAQSIKPLAIDGIICWLLIRRISVRISTLLLPLPVSPNMVTAVSILLGVAGGVLVAFGTWNWTVAGASLLMASLILDNCDGEIARVKYQFSRWGAWFDIYGDFVVNAAFMGGMAVGAWQRFDEVLYLYAGGFALFAFTFYNGTVFRYIHRLGIPDEFLFKWWFDQEADYAEAQAKARGDAPVERPTGPEAGPSTLGKFLSGLKYMGRRDFFIFAYLVTALAGILYVAFWATVVGTVMNFVMTCYQVLLWKGLPDERAS